MNVLEQIDDWPAPTAAAAVVSPDGVITAHGPVEQPFYLASVTKPLAALAVLVAVEEDAVSLEDFVEPDLLPGATLRHALAHASGASANRRARLAPPGTRRIYANLNTELAAEHVAATTGIAFADYLREAVLDPLGMGSTTLDGSPAKDGRASVLDLAAVVQQFLGSPTVLHESTRAEMSTVQFPGLRGVLPGWGTHDPNDWGLGVEIRSHKTPHWTGAANSPRTFGHFGQSGTFLWVDPAARLGLVVLTDRAFGDWARELWPSLSDAVLAAP